jgi:hypothetical protein
MTRPELENTPPLTVAKTRLATRRVEQALRNTDTSGRVHNISEAVAVFCKSGLAASLRDNLIYKRDLCSVG